MTKVFLSAFIIVIFTVFVLLKRSDDTQILSPKESKKVTPNTVSYKDGEYAGDSFDAYWGRIQITAKIQNGKISEIKIMDYPSDRITSERINSEALPVLISEAIQSQEPQVDVVSGATDSSNAFRQSLQSALIKAKI